MATAQSPLTNLGYNLVAWPKTNIQPLLLLYKTDNGVSSVEAYLKDLFKTGDVAPPHITIDEIATDITGSAALTFDAKGGIKILDWLLNKLHLGKLSSTADLNENYEVSVSYLNVTQDAVNLLQLDNFISSAKPSTEKFNAFKKKLENSELYVISGIAKSRDISITISAKNGQDINLDATVKGILEASANTVRKQNNAIELTYKTDEDRPLIFAFKAQQIIYKRKNFWNNEPAKFYIKDQIGVVLLSPEDFPTRQLNTGNTLVDL